MITLLTLTKVREQARELLLLWRMKRFSSVNNTLQNPMAPPKSGECFCCAYVFIAQQHADVDELFAADCCQLKDILANRPLFLNKKQVFEYSRFMGDNAVIVKVFTPESNIMSYNQKLTLRRRGLKKSIVHGIYLTRRASSNYFENPYFAEIWQDKLSLVNHSESVAT